jgi:putative transposase
MAAKCRGEQWRGVRMALRFKPRLSRLDWLYTQMPVYFLTICSDGRKNILANPGVHEAFADYANRAVQHNVWVGRYVLMPDHVHLFAAFSPISPDVSEWVKGLKAVVSRHLKERGLAGPYWQERFFDHVLRSKESHAEKWVYVRENPVRAGLVMIWSDWPFQGEIQRF